jgi:hypothetical protein
MKTEYEGRVLILKKRRRVLVAILQSRRDQKRILGLKNVFLDSKTKQRRLRGRQVLLAVVKD